MWGRREIDLLDAGWHYVYPFACFAGGILCNKLNNKHSLLGIVFFLSILCYTLPTIVKRKSESIGFIAMFSVRVIIGIFQVSECGNAMAAIAILSFGVSLKTSSLRSRTGPATSHPQPE